MVTKAFTNFPLTKEEVAEVENYKVDKEEKPKYAPAILRCFFRANPLTFYTSENVALFTGIPQPQCNVILQRLVRDKFLCRVIQNWGNKTKYYFFPEAA